MLSPVLHAASGVWTLGTIEDHVARPLSLKELESHIAEHTRLIELCANQSAAIRWAREREAEANGREARTETFSAVAVVLEGDNFVS